MWWVIGLGTYLFLLILGMLFLRGPTLVPSRFGRFGDADDTTGPVRKRVVPASDWDEADAPAAKISGLNRVAG